MRTIRVKVKPNSRETAFEEGTDDVWQARIKAPPVDGKANRELISLIAEHFGCAKSQVEIRSGASGRIKLVTIP